MRKRNRWNLVFIFLMAVGAAGAADLPNPFKNPRVGDWVVHELKGRMATKQTIVGLTDDTVTLRIETISDGEVVNTQTVEKVRIHEPDPALLGVEKGSPEPEIREETLTVLGKKIHCARIVTVREDHTSRLWISEEIPVNGIVRNEIRDPDGNVSGTIEAVDWGRGPAPASNP